MFHCGVRRFRAAPIFSQHTSGNKHKVSRTTTCCSIFLFNFFIEHFQFEKFFHPDCTMVASIFAPVSYPPQPVVVFKPLPGGRHVLVATGSLLSVDPNRIICKRAVLSGHPFKIHKKSAVIRYMFLNRGKLRVYVILEVLGEIPSAPTLEDILWFKPVELWTKYGRKGHIKEPLGKH